MNQVEELFTHPVISDNSFPWLLRAGYDALTSVNLTALMENNEILLESLTN